MSLSLELAFLRSVKNVLTCTTLAIQDSHCENRDCPMSPGHDASSVAASPTFSSVQEGCLRGGKPEKMNLGNFWDVSADPHSA